LFDGRVECWLEMVSTNILGNAMMTRAALQDMQRRGSWGHIINMGACVPLHPAFCTTPCTLLLGSGYAVCLHVRCQAV
jgi:NAD(P)-dependent dehydrogenase (short-subunit alcohol dehydrogenase family)